MDARESLISMGFSPDRVDWAIRETPPDADLQMRLEHLMQHESEEVPTAKALSATGKGSDKASGYIYGPPAYSPPTSLAPDHQSRPQASGSTTPSRLAESFNDLRIHQRTPDPLSLSIENESVGRYAGFLATERSRILAAHSSQETAEVLLAAISQFFDEEWQRWQKVLQPSKATSRPVTNHTASNDLSGPPNEGQVQVGNEANLATNTKEAEAIHKSAVYDAIATYDSTRPILPPLESVKKSLNGVVTKWKERDSVETARKRAWEVCTQMEKEVSDLHWQTTVTNPSMLNETALPGPTDVLSQILAMQSRGDYQGAGRFAQQHSQQQAAMQQHQSRTAAEDYRRSYLDPATAAVNKALSESRPLYTEIQTHLEREDKQLDVVKTIRALDQVVSNIECGMTLLEKLDDEKSAQELERRIQEATNRGQFGEVTKLRGQKGSREYEVNAVRASQKVARRAPFFDIAISRTNQSIANLDKDQVTLKEQLKELLTIIPETISLEQEEAQARAGDASPSKIPLPSKDLFNQISEAQSALISINSTALDLRSLLKDLQYQQVVERAESDIAQFTLREIRAGNWAALYSAPGRQLKERASNELVELERTLDGFQQNDQMEMSAIIGPVNIFIARYKAREALVMQRLAVGTNPAPAASSYFSGISGVDPTLDPNVMQRLLAQQYLLNQSPWANPSIPYGYNSD